ncbi:uncharacterized protein LOC126878597 [Diabrotica virgifera virgifera]|uniref:GIY-YIG domain-containing protein n=1 Tax=Diabrotica virgifera virgifera TaxID=50390 RepID=A0ABM5JHF0_DIAVI|nr:uncharacterized protein LOC126878597 [Diabrotica virgifera virgifera]
MKDEETTVNPPSNFQNNLIQQGTVSMFHVNLQCISNKVDMINAFLADKKFYDVICFSEHWQTEENLKLINISGFSLANFFCRVEKKQGGVAIYVKENLMYSSLNLNEYNVEQTSEFCAIYIPSMRTNVLTVYRSGNGDCDLFLVNFENVIAFLLNKADKLIILGDFNINFKIKSDSSYDIQNLLMSFGLEITINDYTRITSQSSSCIDNIMTNFSENIYRVGVFEPCFSDHRAQFISIDSDLKVVDTNQSLQRSITSSGLQKLKYALASTKMDFFYDTNNDPDVLMFFLTETYNNLILKFFPLKKVRQTAKITPVQWFNDELRSYRSNLSLIKHIADVTKDPDIFKLYKQQKYEYNRQLQNAKKSAYSGFIANSNNKPRDCWKILNFERGNTRSSSVQPDLSPDEINQFFITIAENIITSLPTINNDILFSYRNYPSPSKSFCFRPVVEDEISQIIKSLNNSNCKDVHEINSKILKETYQIVLTPFTHLINLILSTGVFPEALKYSKVKDKSDIRDCSNVVYQIPCNNCNLVYVGQTARNLGSRLVSHRSDSRLYPERSALAEHVNKEHHKMNYESVRVLASESNYTKRLFLEMAFISQNSNAMNKRSDINQLSSIYSYLLCLDNYPHFNDVLSTDSL